VSSARRHCRFAQRWHQIVERLCLPTVAARSVEGAKRAAPPRTLDWHTSPSTRTAVRSVRLVLTDTVSEASSELTQGNTDHFKLLHTMIVNVPTSGARTLYVRLGESVGWLCVFAVPALVGLGWMRRRQSRVWDEPD
jgi:hypothetical protein